jgi:hypothetical protein
MQIERWQTTRCAAQRTEIYFRERPDRLPLLPLMRIKNAGLVNAYDG